MLECLTSLFGMGRGVPTLLEAPTFKTQKMLTTCLSKLRLKDPVLQLSLTYQLSRQMRVSNSRPISTPWLNTLLCLHLAPINPVVFRGSITKINLKACFPLICFQRLSVPNVATRQCPWQDSRYTRGSSAPVFSY